MNKLNLQQVQVEKETAESKALQNCVTDMQHLVTGTELRNNRTTRHRPGQSYRKSQL